jgi:hypothetical protein
MFRSTLLGNGRKGLETRACCLFLMPVTLRLLTSRTLCFARSKSSCKVLGQPIPKKSRKVRASKEWFWIQVPQTQLTFHPLAQRNAFRCRDARQQSRLFARP